MAGDRFRYRLGKVLDLRERKEDRTKREKAAAERERDRERDALDELKTRLVGAQKAMGSSLSSGQTANVQMGNDYAAALEKKIADQEKRLAQAEDKLVEFEKSLTLAIRDVKILEKHREKSKERWQLEENKKDAVRLDDVAIQGYRKKEQRRLEDEQEDAAHEASLAAADEEHSAWISGLLASAGHESRRRDRPARDEK